MPVHGRSSRCRSISTIQPAAQLLKNKRSGFPPDEKARRPIYKPEPSPRLEEARARVRGFFDRLNEIRK